MPRHERLALNNGEWVELTSGPASRLSFQLLQGPQMCIAGTVGASAPSAGAWDYYPGQGELNMALSDLFPGMSATRVWARMIGGPGLVFVSHA